MSLVVLRSWAEGAPKVRAIAPPDDDNSIYVPDNHGHFVAKQAIENDARSNGTKGSKQVVQNGNCVEDKGKKSKEEKRRHSSSLSRSSPDDVSSSSRADSVSSPDHDGSSFLDYSPPASPVNGRYRNLGPELAATIPKRTIKNSWIRGIKSRWNNHHRLLDNNNKTGTNTTLTHLHNGKRGDDNNVPCLRSPYYYKNHHHHNNNTTTNSQLKSYSSTPNLYQSKLLVKPFHGVINPLFQEEEDTKSNYYEDSQAESGISNSPSPSVLSQSSCSPSPPIEGSGGNNNNNKYQDLGQLSPLKRNNLHYGSLQEIQQQRRSSSSEGDDNCKNSNGRLNPYELVDENQVNSQAVLVEVIRKEKDINLRPQQGLEANPGFCDKRHSIGPELAENGKFAGVNVDGKKENRLLNSGKRYGKLARRRTEEIYVKCCYDEEEDLKVCDTNGGGGNKVDVSNNTKPGELDCKNSDLKIGDLESDKEQVLESCEEFEQDRSIGGICCSLECSDQQDRSLSSANCPVVEVVVAKKENSSSVESEEKTKEETSMPLKNLGVVMNERCNGASNGKLYNKEGFTERKEKNELSSGRISSNGTTARAQVPVQAVNKHVLGYGIFYRSKSASKEDKSRVLGNTGRNKNALKGFCDNLLENHEDTKLSIAVPEVIPTDPEAAAITFEEDETSSSNNSSAASHLDDEQENSIDYLSVTDVKVNAKRSSQVNDEVKETLPDLVISLDLGSRTSGYALWEKEKGDTIRIGNVNEETICPSSHKVPSWIMIDDLNQLSKSLREKNEHAKTPEFGALAIDKYLTRGGQGDLMSCWRENFLEGAAYPYTLESKSSEDELVVTMRSAVQHYGRLALHQSSFTKTKGYKAMMVITVPACYDQRARQLVREAATKCVMLPKEDAIILIDDPFAGGLYAYHALKTKLTEMTKNGMKRGVSYLSFDLGGFYIHSSGFEINDGKLKQIFQPKSEPIIDGPETLFEAELSAIFTSSFVLNYQSKYKAGWLKLMTEFEKAKNRFSLEFSHSYYIFVPSSFSEYFRRFTNMEIEDALENSDILWNKSGALGVPHRKMQKFLQPLLDLVKDKVVNLVKKYHFDHVVLSGGRAGSKFFVDAIHHAVKDYSVSVHLPMEHTAAVLQGAVISITNLAPQVTFKCPFSIGVGVMTPFVEKDHPEAKRVRRDGKSWCADVWDSLIQLGQELQLNKEILKRSYVGAQPGQSILNLPLYQSPLEPKFVTEPEVKKCCELKFNCGQRAWQEVELVIKCRPSELHISAVEEGIVKQFVVIDFCST